MHLGLEPEQVLVPRRVGGAADADTPHRHLTDDPGADASRKLHRRLETTPARFGLGARATLLRVGVVFDTPPDQLDKGSLRSHVA